MTTNKRNVMNLEESWSFDQEFKISKVNNITKRSETSLLIGDRQLFNLLGDLQQESHILVYQLMQYS